MTNKHIKKVIISSPYDKPDKYLKYNNGIYTETKGRRPFGYRTMSKNGDYGTPVPITAVNYIREKVDEWRKAEYPGITDTTRELLDHWYNITDPKLFFCQLEAIESIIYLNEVNPGIFTEIPGFKHDSDKFMRQCSKMATGTGKTIVMAMLIVWQVLNNKDNKNKYTKNILVVSPSLIVLDRLQVLNPKNNENIYDEFNLIPADKRNILTKINIKITNWHKFKLKEKPDHANHALSKIGPESVETFAKRIFNIKNKEDIIVINDEGHHAWRHENYKADKFSTKDIQTAGIWMKGLDMLNDIIKIKTCFDFSATPFVSTGRTLDEEMLFSWIISDFSLEDAVESGLIKTPRAVITDKNELPKYQNIYREEKVRNALKNNKIHPDIIHVYKLLGNDWKYTNEAWKKNNAKTSPVMITVCNETNHAKLITDAIKNNELSLPPELCNDDSILQIDSATAKRIEEGKEKRGDYTLREKASSVGRIGKPGEKINNIIAVNMLNEGWDTKTVTHIMGLRAFSSQLLCEQIIGRGLRRISYDINKEGLFEKEQVTIVGVPYGFLPTEIEPTISPSQPVEIVLNNVKYQIGWPIVEHVIKNKKYGWKLVSLQKFKLNNHIPTDIEFAKIIDGISEYDYKGLKNNDLHIQQVEFGILQILFNRGLKETWTERNKDLSNSSSYKEVIEILDIVSDFLDNIETNLTGQNLTKSLFYNRDKISDHILTYLEEYEKDVYRVIINNYDSTNKRKSRFTNSKNIYNPKKTHLSLITCGNDFEKQVCEKLDENENIQSWIKADMVGFNIKYDDLDTGFKRHYRPGFIIHLKNGINLILEWKDKERENFHAKTKAIEEWVDAVNSTNKDGNWAFAVLDKKDATTEWMHDLQNILNTDYDIRHECDNCHIGIKGTDNIVEKFHLFTDNGILKYSSICINCMENDKVK